MMNLRHAWTLEVDVEGNDIPSLTRLIGWCKEGHEISLACNWRSLDPPIGRTTFRAVWTVNKSGIYLLHAPPWAVRWIMCRNTGDELLVQEMAADDVETIQADLATRGVDELVDTFNM